MVISMRRKSRNNKTLSERDVTLPQGNFIFTRFPLQQFSLNSLVFQSIPNVKPTTPKLKLT